MVCAEMAYSTMTAEPLVMEEYLPMASQQLEVSRAESTVTEKQLWKAA
jgi:hypothetical protein